MEEKILAKLDSLENKMDEKFEDLKEELRSEFKQENTKLKEELYNKMDQKNAELKAELKKEIYNKIDQKNAELREDLERQILNHMFVFEEDYGKRLTIAYEDLTCRHATEETNTEKIANLEKRETLNTAYVQSHETRIQKLEKIQA